jgi:hypothetical protein
MVFLCVVSGIDPDDYRDCLFDYLILPRKRFILKNNMGLHNELPVYKASYDLLIEIFQFTKEFSKDYKYTVGESLKKETIELLTLIYRANSSRAAWCFTTSAGHDFQYAKYYFKIS